MATGVCRRQRRIARSFIRVLIGAQVTGYCLGVELATCAGVDARVMASGKMGGVTAMEARLNAAATNKQSPTRRSVQTPSGRISYAEQGEGPVALFVHGVLLNGHLWRHQLADLSNIRRCIAVDLLAHGDTEIAPDQDVSVTANAKMLKEFLDALNIEQVDLVGNDSGGAIAQIFAANYPHRLRSLVLTNCDVHDGWPPPQVLPIM
ncbi:MAG TPA: alpha/beta fold hydrolase, partial [Burkholderiales bacterium]|nr:alpha/beta fold hydrolase [Burkholderiales bacterium]